MFAELFAAFVNYVVIPAIVAEASDIIVDAIQNVLRSGSTPNGGVSPQVFGRGGQTGQGDAHGPPLSGCHGYICHISGDGTTDVIVERTTRDTCSWWTGCKFENGGGSLTLIRSTIGKWMFPSVYDLGERGKPGSLRDNLTGAGKVVYNTVVGLADAAQLAVNPLAWMTSERPPTLTIKDEELAGAAIAEGLTVVLSLGAAARARLAARVPNSTVSQGDRVFRVWGDDAAANGRSWTRADPRTVENYRDAAGLPNQNTGRFVTEGTLTDTAGVS